MSGASYNLAKIRYARLRRAAYDITAVEWSLTTHPPVRLTDIDSGTLKAWQTTWTRSHPNGRGGWNWSTLADEFRTDPAAFKPALWSDGILCGMALGRTSHPSSGGTRNAIAIHYLESHPDPSHPLKGSVALLLITAAEFYGKRLGASKIRLVDPAPGAVHIYVQLGFAVARKPSGLLYCEKEIAR